MSKPQKQTDNVQIVRHDYDSSTSNPDSLRLANEAPPWRAFGNKTNIDGDFNLREMDPEQIRRGQIYDLGEKEALFINTALILRRPLLISGNAGVGKTSLAYAIAWQLGLGNVLTWPITSRSVLKDGLYQYDAVGRLQDASLAQNKIISSDVPKDIGRYITLGPLGTALLPNKTGPYYPRVLLIDEIDKCDIDLPNDLLHVLEEGSFEIPEISRYENHNPKDTVTVKTWGGESKVEIPSNGMIRCDDFPLIIMTTNDERDFSPAFRRRCIEISIQTPNRQKLERIVRSQLSLRGHNNEDVNKLIEIFESRIADESYVLAVDQLLNAIFLSQSKYPLDPLKQKDLLEKIFGSLVGTPGQTEK